MIKAAKDLTALLMGSGVGLVFGVLTTVLLARFLGPQLYGNYQVVLNIVWFFVILFSMGFDSSVFYFSSKKKNRKKFVGTAFTSITFLGLLGSFVLFLISPLISNLYPVQNIEFYIRIMCLEVFFYSVFLLFVGSLNGLSLFKRGSFLQISFNSLRIPLIVLPAAVFGIIGAMLGRIFDWVITIILGIYLIKNFIDLDIKKSVFKKLFSYGFPIYISTFFIMLNNRFPTLYLGKFGGFEVGVFSSAFLIYGSLATIINNFNKLGVQRISARKNKKEKLDLYKKLKKYVLLFSSFVLFMIFPFSNQIINIIFGPEYMGAGLPLQIMIIALFLLSIIYPTKSLILGTGKTKLLRNFVFIQLIVTLVSGFFLIDSFRILGASLTILISSISQLVLYSLYEKRSGLDSRTKTLFKSIISGGLMLVSVFIVNLFFGTYLSIILGAFIGSLVFVFSSIKLGIIVKGDLLLAEEFLLDLKINLKKFGFWERIKLLADE